MADKTVKVKGYERKPPEDRRISSPQSDRPGATIIGGGPVTGVVTHSKNEGGHFPDVETQQATREHFEKVKKGTEES